MYLYINLFIQCRCFKGDFVVFYYCRKERQFKVAIKLASKPDIHYLREFLCRRHFEAPQETIQVLDVVLRDTPSKKYAPVKLLVF